MNHIVMCVTLDLPWFHGQQRLGSIESLDLRVFNDAEHQGVLGRVHVQAYDTADLLNELPVFRDLERFRAEAWSCRKESCRASPNHQSARRS